MTGPDWPAPQLAFKVVKPKSRPERGTKLTVARFSRVGAIAETRLACEHKRVPGSEA
jgi:hypothetical protein